MSSLKENNVTAVLVHAAWADGLASKSVPSFERKMILPPACIVSASHRSGGKLAFHAL